MNKLSIAAARERIPLPQNMNEALALVRAGKLQQASDLLLGGQLASGPTSTKLGTEPDITQQASRFGDQMARGWASMGQAFDVSDVLARSGLNGIAQPDGATTGTAKPTDEAPGQFERVAFRHGSQDHPYWLYEPKTAAAATGRPLVLMLHGCTQDAEDFSRGTQMNAAAEGAGALVLYPNQTHNANANGCWNWFRPQDQQAGSGEPAMLVAMVRDAMASHDVDPRRVYVAGLSAGGAMAAVLAQQYPEVFAAAGVHSGLAAGAAHNMMGALSAMNSGAKGLVAAPATGARTVPLIVMHGDADATVHPRNGEQLLESAAASVPTSVQLQETGTTPDGQRYTHTTVQDTATAPPAVLAEHWLLHGAGHAWSGGDARGSHSSGNGVNASAEMLRFFLAHPREGRGAAA